MENKAMEPTFWGEGNQANSRRENVLQRDVLKLKQQLSHKKKLLLSMSHPGWLIGVLIMGYNKPYITG